MIGHTQRLGDLLLRRMGGGGGPIDPMDTTVYDPNDGDGLLSRTDAVLPEGGSKPDSKRTTWLSRSSQS